MSETPSQQPPIDALTFDTPPNRLTLLRILAVPAVVGLLAFPGFHNQVAAAVIFSLAAITDFFDGWLARTYNAVTIYGKLLDPLADKFIVVGTLIMLQHLDRVHPFVVIVLICRELGITSLRALASAEGVIIAAGSGGKWKAALQMVGVPFLIIHETLWGVVPCYWIGTGLLYVSVFLSLTSAFTYASGFFQELRSKRKKKA